MSEKAKRNDVGAEGGMDTTNGSVNDETSRSRAIGTSTADTIHTKISRIGT